MDTSQGMVTALAPSPALWGGWPALCATAGRVRLIECTDTCRTVSTPTVRRAEERPTCRGVATFRAQKWGPNQKSSPARQHLSVYWQESGGLQGETGLQLTGRQTKFGNKAPSQALVLSLWPPELLPSRDAKLCFLRLTTKEARADQVFAVFTPRSPAARRTLPPSRRYPRGRVALPPPPPSRCSRTLPSAHKRADTEPAAFLPFDALWLPLPVCRPLRTPPTP